MTRRSGLSLLGALLALAAIPIFATARILDQNAVRNARAHADAALRVELESAVRQLGQLGDDAAARVGVLARSPEVQDAFISRDRAALARLARQHPGIVFNLGRAIAATTPAAVRRSVSLTVNGERIGSLVGTVPLDQRLADRLLDASPHARVDRLLLVREGRVLGSKRRLDRAEGGTIRLQGRRFRALLTPIPNGQGTRLAALRDAAAVDATVRPYQQRILYAAIGSFAMLVLVSLLFARPILNALGDFRRLASQATTDALSGLANRRSFDEELALEWHRAERVGDPLAVILADIDDFKRINDTYGHQVGDDVLAAIGKLLSSRVRGHDFAARYGGEEFAVLLPETELAGARTLAQRLRRDLVKARVPLRDGSELRVTASFGVAEKGDLERGEDLIAAADAALYEAKKRGKNRVATRRARVAAAG